MIKKKIDTAIKDVLLIGNKISDSDIPRLLYFDIFGTMPTQRYKFDKEKNIHIYVPTNSQNEDIQYDFETVIDVEKFYDTAITKYNAYYYNIQYNDIFIFYNEQVIVELNIHNLRIVVDDTIVPQEKINEFIKNLQNDIQLNTEDHDDDIDIGILSHRNGGYFVEDHFIKKMNIEVDKIYNDDIPIERIDDFVSSDETGLILFYGEPGTGKTTYIKHLISKHNDKEFIILDSNILADITSNSLLSEFLSHDEAIWILEDCEKLLVSRDEQPNPIISAFLNMSDGILASILKCKFICTFNTDIENIDSALTRKGRMKVKYEFKKLSKDKAKKINSEVKDDITLADLFFMNKENDFSKKQRGKIGF